MAGSYYRTVLNISAHLMDFYNIRTILRKVIAFSIFAGAVITVNAVEKDVMKIVVWEPGLGSVALNIKNYTFQLDGPIDAGAASRLRSHLQAIKGGQVTYWLNSPGGSMTAGMELGRIIRQTGIFTNVGRYRGEDSRSTPGGCYSSCALAFLGGRYRYLENDSEYGVHRFSRTNTSIHDLDDAQVISANVAAYIREMDVDPALFDLMTRTSKDQIYVLTKKQLTDLNVINNGRLRSKWSIEAIDNTMYLRGLQETVWGIGKALFVCGRGVIFNSFAPVSKEQADSMIRGEWVHSLVADSNVMPIAPIGKWRYDGYYLNIQFLLTPSQVQNMMKAKTIGHAIQVNRDAPTFVGYNIEIPTDQSQKINAFLKNCPQS